ncbi:FAD-binding oxidoreductase [Kibdelosporangium persicum]|uniref:FAD-binding oxidoreductase n=1 Tax=Kibdelosporangium persicum TaxID=2698649 RepID=A0ABX2F1Z8_9PSEU|nr:FAD-binding protein [Kibdelosporangium persicum]NRN65011.1 FAD-binding oxidoreductase [Kibdelosporangium persicum]
MVNRRGFLATTATLGAAVALPGEAVAQAEQFAVGPVTIGPDDPRYEDLAVRTKNDRFVTRPESFRIVGTTDQVVRVVDEAARAGKRITVRSGGHCYENFVGEPAPGVIIDMIEMNRVYFDARRRAFAVESGALLSDVYETLYYGWGVTIPAGQCGTVAVGGQIQGGGYGPLSRTLGSVVDYLEAVEVVVVDRNGRARAVVASRDPRDPDHDLWWAHTGGGGGNFGVVTRYWLRTPGARGNDPTKLLPKPPRGLLSGAAFWKWDDLGKEKFRRLLANHGAWHERTSVPGAPGGGVYGVFMIGGKGLSPMGLPGDLILLAQVDAYAPGAEQQLRDFFAAVAEGVGGEPSISPQPTPWHTTVRGNVEGVGEIDRQKNKAAYLRRRFTDSQADTIYDTLTAEQSQLDTRMLWLVSYGGKVNEVDPAATASPQRDSMLKAIYITSWQDPAKDQQHIDWVRQFYRAVYKETGGVPVPNEVSDGSYINYPDVDLADPSQNTSGVPWYTLYYKDNYPRLQRVKAKYDPRDVFTHALGIRPA